MRTACFIPIKEQSERVPGKNLRLLCGKKLYSYIIDNTIKANCFDCVYIDTNSAEIREYCIGLDVEVIERATHLATNDANGNDLLVYHKNKFPDYDFYFQLFATAPFLQSSTIKACYDALTSTTVYDSCFTASENKSFYWFNDLPVNYRPNILPRSQDMVPVYEETTGLYGICHESLEKYSSRIGKKPYIHKVDKFESIDINNEEDLKIAEFIGEHILKF